MSFLTTEGTQSASWSNVVAARDMLISRLCIENASRLSTISRLTAHQVKNAVHVTEGDHEEYQVDAHLFKTAGYVFTALFFFTKSDTSVGDVYLKLLIPTLTIANIFLFCFFVNGFLQLYLFSGMENWRTSG